MRWFLLLLLPPPIAAPLLPTLATAHPGGLDAHTPSSNPPMQITGGGFE